MPKTKEEWRAYYQAYKETDAYKAYLERKRQRYSEDEEFRLKTNQRNQQRYYANREMLNQLKQSITV